MRSIIKRTVIGTMWSGAGFAVASCGGTTTPPAVEVRTVTKTVEVQRPCSVTAPPRPAKLPRPLPTDSVALAALLAEHLAQYDAPGGFADRALAAIATCTKP